MQNNAIMFTSYQLQLMQDAQLMLAKREIIEKTAQLWAQLALQLQQIPYTGSPKNASAPTTENINITGLELNSPYIHKLKNALGVDEFRAAKITRGENYKGLPYVVLDYHSYFNKDDVFTYRCIFWWGNYFSFQLMAQGQPKQNLQRLISTEKIKNIPDIFVGLGKKLWEYEFNPENYTPAAAFTSIQLQEKLQEHAFIKLATKLPLYTPAPNVIAHGKEFFVCLMDALEM